MRFGMRQQSDNMRNYYIEILGKGISSFTSPNLLSVAKEFDGIVDSLVKSGWTVVDRDLRLGVELSSVILKRKDEDGMVSVSGYQIKSVEIYDGERGCDE